MKKSTGTFGIMVGIVAIIVSITIPEIRIFLGLEEKKEQTETSIDFSQDVELDIEKKQKKENKINRGAGKDTVKNISNASNKIVAIDEVNEKKIEIDNIYDFVKNIKSHTALILKEGTYNFSTLPGRIDDQYFTFDTRYSKGYGFVATIKNVSHFSLIGLGNVQIITDNDKEDVLIFRNTDNIKVENIKFGHSEKVYDCEKEANVLEFHSCDKVYVNQCSFWGSGSIGLVISGSRNFEVSNSRIFGCTHQAISMVNSNNLIFDKITIDENNFSDVFEVNKVKNVKVINSAIRKNTAKLIVRNYNWDSVTEKIIFENTIFYMNMIDSFFNQKEKISLIDCEFDFNEFVN